MIFIGNVIIVAIFLASIWLSGISCLVFYDLPSVCLAVFPAVILWRYTSKDFWLGVKIFFRPKFTPISGDDVQNYARTGQLFSRMAVDYSIYAVLVFIGGILTMNVSPQLIGPGMAVGLLGSLYCVYLSLFVFLPISLRCGSLLPEEDKVSKFSRCTVNLGNVSFLLTAVCIFMILRGAFLILLTVLSPDKAGNWSHALFFSMNPIYGYYGESVSGGGFFGYFDFPSLIVMAVSILVFTRMAGQLYRLYIIPFCVLAGLFWMMMGCILMLGSLTPATIGAGFGVSSLTLLYGVIAAVYYWFVNAKSVCCYRHLGSPIGTA